MSTASYTRISQDRDDDKVKTAEQLAKIKKLADAKDLVLDPDLEFSDNGISAFKFRPSYRELVAQLRAGRVDTVLVWHQDRMYRSIKDLLELAEIAKDHPFEIVAVQGPTTDFVTATGRMTATILASIAQYESEHKAERQAEGNARRAKAGIPHTGGRNNRPLGFMPDAVTVNPVEKKLLVAAAKMIVAKRGTLAKATEYVNQNWPEDSDRQPPFTEAIIKGVLTSERMIGNRMYLPITERKKPRHEQQPVLAKQGAWEPVLDEPLFRAVRAKLNGAVGDRRRSVLGGLIRCGQCGKPMNRGAKNYQCSKSERYGNCGNVAISESVESVVMGHIAGFPVMALDVLKALAGVSTAPNPDEARLEELDAAIRNCTRVEIVAKSAVARDQAAKDRELFEDEYQVVLARLRRTQRERGATAASATEALRVLSLLDEADDDQRRTVVHALLERIDIAKAANRRPGKRLDYSRITVHWKPMPGQQAGAVFQLANGDEPSDEVLEAVAAYERAVADGRYVPGMPDAGSADAHG